MIYRGVVWAVSLQIICSETSFQERIVQFVAPSLYTTLKAPKTVLVTTSV